MTHPFLPDMIALGIIALSILISLLRGLIRELISLASWCLAAWFSIRYSNQIAEYFTFTDIPSLRVFLAFLVIFIGMIFLGAIVNFMIGQLVRKTPFSAVDRILGMGFGAVRGVLGLSVLVLLAGLTPVPKDKWFQNSYAISHVQPIALWMKGCLPLEVAQYFDFSSRTPFENSTIPSKIPHKVDRDLKKSKKPKKDV